MWRFVAGISGSCLLCACATLSTGPHLSPANVRRIADEEVRRTKEIDPRRYSVTGPTYIFEGHYWLVTYQRNGRDRGAFSVRIADRKETSDNERAAGIFEGGLPETSDYH